MKAKNLQNRWILVVIWLGVIFGLSSIPAAELPPMPSPDWLFWAHRVAHMGEYGVLGILVIRAHGYGRAGIGVPTILFLSVFILGAGLFDEWHQSFVPGRHSQLIDAYFDLICGTAGMFVYYIWRRWNLIS